MVDSWNAAQINEAVNNGSVGGGSSLPEVTASDNGDVLTVVNGAWGKATPSASGYSPNYSTTEAEVGISFGNKPIYGRLVDITAGSLSNSGFLVSNTTTFPEIEKIISAKIFAYIDTSNHYPIVSSAQAYMQADDKLYGKVQPEISAVSGAGYPKQMYIEYTKVTQSES